MAVAGAGQVEPGASCGARISEGSEKGRDGLGASVKSPGTIIKNCNAFETIAKGSF